MIVAFHFLGLRARIRSYSFLAGCQHQVFSGARTRMVTLTAHQYGRYVWTEHGRARLDMDGGAGAAVRVRPLEFPSIRQILNDGPSLKDVPAEDPDHRVVGFEENP